MKITLSKSRIEGKVAAPPSKSYTIRALMCAALAPGESFIRHPLEADDTRAAREVLIRVGVSITPGRFGWRVSGGQLRAPSVALLCRDSAATMRFMMAIAALVPGTSRLVPGPSLARRPVQPLVEALRRLGVRCALDGPVVVVEGGRLAGGDVSLPGDVSSQFVSALLLIAPLAEKGLSIELTTPPRSRPYLDMTLACLKEFGVRVRASADLKRFSVSRQEYRPASYRVGGDWSQASYLLALGALAGEVIVTNLDPESLQADRVVLNWLQKMGATLSVRGSSVMVSKSSLRAITADLSDAIDLLPTMAVLAAVAEGDSELTGMARARLKESNRVLAVRESLERMGIRVIEEEDRLRIAGGKPRGGVIDSYSDHRIAMAFGVLGAAVGRGPPS